MGLRMIILVLAIMSLTSCSYSHVKGVQPGEVDLGKSGTCGPVDFNTINVNVFKKSCTGCHSEGSGFAVNGLYFEDYTSISANIGASIASIKSGKMPKLGRPVSIENLELLVAWENQRTPEFTDEPPVQSCQEVAFEPPPEVDVLEANYNSIRKHILEVKCSGCHGINHVKPKPPKYKFGTYSDMVSNTELFTPANEQSRFAVALIIGEMPVVGDLLTDQEINVVVEWIKAGLPESNAEPAALLPNVVNTITSGGQP